MHGETHAISAVHLENLYYYRCLLTFLLRKMCWLTIVLHSDWHPSPAFLPELSGVSYGKNKIGGWREGSEFKTALPEVLSSIPSNHMVIHNHL